MSDLYLKRLPDSNSDEEDDFAWKVPCTILEQQQHSNNLNKELNDCYHGDETNDETDDEIVTFAERRHHEQQQSSNNLNQNTLIFVTTMLQLMMMETTTYLISLNSNIAVVLTQN